MDTKEKWEVDIGTGRYQADLETIKSWLREGRIKATDQVRKEGLDWTRISSMPQFLDIKASERPIAGLATGHVGQEIPSVPTGTRKCSACAEEILAAALKCRHCGSISIEPTWKNLYHKYSSMDEAARGATIAAMSKKEIDYFRHVIEFGNYAIGAPGPDQRVDYSRLIGYSYKTSESSQWKAIFAYNEEQARELASRDLPRGVEIKKFIAMAFGRYPCPRCGNRYTSSHRNVGCAILIIIFVSLGLGLILIPLLPYNCWCAACNHWWRS